MEVKNDSHTPTGLNKITDGLLSPEITLAGKNIAHLCTWRRDEPIGNSDHWPILITIHEKVQHQDVLGKEPKWKRKDVEWEAMSKAVDELCNSLPTANGPEKRVERLTNIMIAAGEEHVGKVKPGCQRGD